MLLFLVAKPGLAWMLLTLSIDSWGLYILYIPSRVNRRVLLNKVIFYYPDRKLTFYATKSQLSILFTFIGGSTMKSFAGMYLYLNINVYLMYGFVIY